MIQENKLSGFEFYFRQYTNQNNKETTAKKYQRKFTTFLLLHVNY